MIKNYKNKYQLNSKNTLKFNKINRACQKLVICQHAMICKEKSRERSERINLTSKYFGLFQVRNGISFPYFILFFE